MNELPEEVKKYMADMGKKGGKTTGESKRRDQKDPNFYSRIGKMKKSNEIEYTPSEPKLCPHEIVVNGTPVEVDSISCIFCKYYLKSPKPNTILCFKKKKLDPDTK